MFGQSSQQSLEIFNRQKPCPGAGLFQETNDWDALEFPVFVGYLQHAPQAGQRAVAFEDATRMGVQNRVEARKRPLPTPVWAVRSDQSLRRGVLHFVECRFKVVPKWNDIDHLSAVRDAMQAAIPLLLARLDKLCHDYVSQAEPAQKSQLARQIENLDCQIRVCQQGPAIFFALAFRYWRLGWDSPQVAGFSANDRNMGSPDTVALCAITSKTAARCARGLGLCGCFLNLRPSEFLGGCDLPSGRG